MGVDDKAVIHNMRELRQRVAWIINEYQQPALVEEFLPGREFTIGVLGREDAILYSRRPDLYRSDGFHRFNTLEVDAGKSVTPGVYGHTAKTLKMRMRVFPASSARQMSPAHWVRNFTGWL